MKKRNCLLVLAALCALLVVWICVDEYRVHEFTLSNFHQDCMEQFPYDAVVGPVKDAKTARQKAFELWSKVYGEEMIEEEKPYTVCYDKENDVWLVCGSKPIFTLGGVAQIIIRASDGQVLALWHSK